MSIKIKGILKNSISSMLTYGVLMLLNLAVSNIVLHTYGSEMNGLVASVNQIFSYIAMLEAGIGTATVNAFYKPIVYDDSESIIDIFVASLRYFRRTTVGYILCAVGAAVLWPFAVDSQIGYWTIFFIIIFHGVSNALSFCFTSTMSAYLLASGKNYVNTYFHSGVTILTYIVKILICYSGWSYIAISLSLVFINLLKCIGYYIYRKIKCKELAELKAITKIVLPQRNYLLVHEISGAIFASTDVIIISIFCDLKSASIYSVYSLLFVAASGIISQVFNSLTYVLGDAYSEKTNFVRIVDSFKAIYTPVVFSIYTAIFLMLESFVSLYTRGITDVDYQDACLSLLFVIIQLLSSCRIVDGAIIKIAQHADRTLWRSIFESAINIIFSLLLIQYIGIYGVLLGTIIALLYRSNDVIIYTSKHILKTSLLKEYKLYISNFIVFVGFVVLKYSLNITANSYLELMIKALFVLVLVSVVYFGVDFFINRGSMLMLFKKQK